MFRISPRWCLFFILLIENIAIIPLHSATITGQVLDAVKRTPLEGAEIILISRSVGTVSDPQGRFMFSAVRPGVYTIQVQFIGYQAWRKKLEILSVRDTVRLTIYLNPVSYSGDEVIVSVSPYYRPGNEFNGVYHLSSQEIWEEPAALTDPQRALTQIPSVVSVTDQYNEFSVRGGAPWENAFYINDFLIRNPNHFGFQGSSGGAFSFINPFVVQQVHFYSGNFPVEYNGALSSITRYELRDYFSSKLIINANFAGIDGVIPFSGGNHTFGGFITGRKSFLKFIGTEVGLTTIPDYSDAMVYSHIKFNSRLHGEILMVGMNDKVFMTDNRAVQGYTQGIPEAQARFKQFLFGGTVKGILGRHLFFKFTMYKNINQWRFHIATSREVPPYMQNRSREKETTMQLKFVAMPNNTFEWSGGATLVTADVSHFLQWNADRLVASHISGMEREDGLTIKKQNAFLEYQYAFFTEIAFQQENKFRFSAGVHYQTSRYLRAMKTSPRLAVSVGNTEAGWVHLALQRNFQWPSYLRITLLSPGNHPKVPQVDQFSVAFEKQWNEHHYLNLEGYYKRYRDVPFLFRFDSPGYLYAYSYDSLVSATQAGKVYGAEFSWGNAHSQKVHWKVALFTIHSRFLDWRNGQNHPGNFDVPFGVSFTGTYRWSMGYYRWYQKLRSKWYFNILGWFLPIGDRMALTMQMRWAVGRPFTQPEYDYTQRRWIISDNVGFNLYRYPYYSRLDVRLAKEVKIKNSELKIYLNIANLLNRKNIWEYQYLDNGTVLPLYQFQTLPFLGILFQY